MTDRPEGWKQESRRHYEAKVYGKASPSTEVKPKYPSKGVKITNLAQGKILQKNLEDALRKNGFTVHPASRWNGYAFTDEPVGEESKALTQFEDGTYSNGKYITRFGTRKAIEYIESVEEDNELDRLTKELEELTDDAFASPKRLPFMEPERRSKSGKTYSEVKEAIKRNLERRPVIHKKRRLE